MFPATVRAAQDRDEERGRTASRAQRAETDGGDGGNGMRLHVLDAHIPIPYVTPGDAAASARAVTSRLPSPRKLAFYGALGVLAVAGALEWPVALVVGAATEVVTRERERGETQPEREERQKEPERKGPRGGEEKQEARR